MVEPVCLTIKLENILENGVGENEARTGIPKQNLTPLSRIVVYTFRLFLGFESEILLINLQFEQIAIKTANYIFFLLS